MSDPTAIPLEVDPLHQRMRGVAVHGRTPFDVPFISRITDDLWTGGCESGLVLPKHIEHVVSLYPWESYEVRHEVRSFLTVRMYDDLAGPALGEIDAIAAWVNACRSTGVTLVHCQAGLNRSALIAARALMLDGRSAAEAIALLRDQRSPAVLCNPSFERFLLTLEGGP